VSAAVANGLEADTLQYRHRQEFRLGGPSRGVLIGEGVVDARSRRARGTWDYSQMPSARGMGRPERFDRIDYVIDGTIGYYRIAALAGRRRPWVKVDFARLGKTSRDPALRLWGEALSSPTGPDPAKLLDDLVEEVGEFKEAGEEELFGVHTTRFRGEESLARLVRGTGVDAEAAATALGDHMVIQLWVDELEWPRRFRMETERKGAFVLEESYSDFDVDVHIRPPARRRVQAIDDVSGAGALLGFVSAAE
jgi:hypothetical protein